MATGMHVVVVGAGHAAAGLCAALKESGFASRITIIGDEAHAPYQRPPLSKGLIKDPQPLLQEIRGASFYQELGATLLLRARVVGVRRAQRTVDVVVDGALQSIAYDHLVLATGTRPRRLPGCAPSPGNGIHELRTFDDALRLREDLAGVQRVLVVGGGFIGLELAATLRQMGRVVTVAEAGPRLLGRAASAELSDHVLQWHRAEGTDVRLDAKVQAPRFDERGRIASVAIDGESLAVDALIIGIGAVPNDELARDAGLPCADGIVVDRLLATPDACISAIGDCARFPAPDGGGTLRLESIQNAQDQARTLAERLCGHARPYAAVPWFWSDQGGLRLQMVGRVVPGLEAVRRDGARAGSFSLFHFDGPVLRAVESVNAPVDHMAARKWLPAGMQPGRADLADAGRPLKELPIYALGALPPGA
jgi:3-phenylpropionate/trans-cinnamate dioxygenase ferredoxin reductase component